VTVVLLVLCAAPRTPTFKIKFGVKHIIDSNKSLQTSQECVFHHAIVFIICQLVDEHKLFYGYVSKNVNSTTLNLHSKDSEGDNCADNSDLRNNQNEFTISIVWFFCPYVSVALTV